MASKVPPPRVQPLAAASVAALPSRPAWHVAVEAAARERAAVFAMETAFELPVRSMAGGLLAVLPGARAGWTRVEVLAGLTEHAPPSAGQFYKFIVGGRTLAGALSLRDLGIASNGPIGGGDAALAPDSAGDADLYAVVIGNEALPILAEAREGLQCIHTGSLVEALSMKRPPPPVLVTMEAICVLLSLRPVQVQTEYGLVNDYWPTVQKDLLRNPQQLLEKLMGLDPDANPPAICDILDPYVDRADFRPEMVVAASQACAAICQWCHALHAYCRVAEATGLA